MRFGTHSHAARRNEVPAGWDRECELRITNYELRKAGLERKILSRSPECHSPIGLALPLAGIGRRSGVLHAQHVTASFANTFLRITDHESRITDVRILGNADAPGSVPNCSDECKCVFLPVIALPGPRTKIFTS